jgi:hypothetical protein
MLRLSALLAYITLIALASCTQTALDPAEFKAARLGEGVVRAAIFPKDDPATNKAAAPQSPLAKVFMLPPVLSVLTSYCSNPSKAVCPLTKITHERTVYLPSNLTRAVNHENGTSVSTHHASIVYRSDAKAAEPLRVLLDCHVASSDGSPSGAVSLNITNIHKLKSSDGFINYLWTLPVPCTELTGTNWIEDGWKRMLRREARRLREEEEKIADKERAKKNEGKSGSKEECCPCK